jgi:ATP-dependent Clp protease ATP-binding subunit ClpB
MTNKGRQFLLEEGTDQRYGARHLKRAIERYVVSPLARLLATGQLQSGDVLLIDRHPGEKGLAFLKDKEQLSFHAQMPFLASHSLHLATAEVRG